MRSLISYHFSEAYSHLQTDYLNPANYDITPKNKSEIAKLTYMLSKEANMNTDHPYVVYQRATYGDVPLWVVLNTLTFGQISKMYSLLTASPKAKISLHFHAVSEKELAQYLKTLTHFRNVCAHNERLFSFGCRIDIPDTRLHGKLSIPRKGTQYLQGKSDLFAVVIALRYLLSRKDFSTFRQELSRLISTLLKQSPMLPEERLLTAMGFPGSWKSLTRYRL